MPLWLVLTLLFAGAAIVAIIVEAKAPVHEPMSPEEEREWLLSMGLSEEEIKEIQDA